MKEKIRFGNYIVHYKVDDIKAKFDVYPIVDFWDGKREGFCYIDKENEPDTREEFEEGKCLMKMQGSIMQRGVWDGRLYFPDQEYWDHELKELADLYNDHILPFLKEKIIKC